jgi:tripartite ATP-independent transporter DctP family solute receptor
MFINFSRKITFGLVMIILIAFVFSSIALAKEIKVTFATYMPSGKTEEKAMEYFKELVEKKSDGEITVETFYGGVLGGERDQNDLVSVGEIQLAITGNRLGSGVCPELMAMDVPYVISSEENLFRVWNGAIGERIKKKLQEERDTTILGIQRRGARNLSTKGYIGLTPEDIKGMKLRLPEIKEWTVCWKELGTIPVPMDSTEVFSGLQMGVIDGQENPVSSVHHKKIWEVQDYYILTGHLHNYFLYIANYSWLNSLDDDIRKIIVDSIEEAVNYANEWDRENEKILLVDLQKRGIDVVIPNIKAYQAKVAPAVKELTQSWAEGVYEEIVRIEGHELY